MRIWPLRWADFPKHSSKTTWPCQLSLLEDQRGVGKVAAGGDTGKLITKQGHSRSACLFLQSSLINTLSEQSEKTTGCGFIASLYFHSTVLIMTSFSHCTHVFVPNDNLSNWCIMKSLPYANRFICALQACLMECRFRWTITPKIWMSSRKQIIQQNQLHIFFFCTSW